MNGTGRGKHLVKVLDLHHIQICLEREIGNVVRNVVTLNKFFKKAYADGSMKTIAEKYGVQAALIEQK